MTIVAFTGSRPQSLGGYRLPNPIYIHVCQQTDKLLRELKPSKAISGMCIGYDQWCANICVRLGIPFVAACPFKGQELLWASDVQKAYHQLLGLACETVIVSPGGYSADKMWARNRYLVDGCDILICAWDGQSSGTRNCVEYAKSVGREIRFINPHP